MDRYTRETLSWLELRFDPEAHRAMGREYRPYQPVHGIPDGGWGPSEYLMAARICRLLGCLGGRPPATFLDVGGAEGFIAHVVGEVSGARAASVDLSLQAGLRAAGFFGVPSAAVESAHLPFADASFDVVHMSEVLEHLADPVRALLELRRVARRAVIVTTEAYARTQEERRDELEARRLQPHMDRSILCPGDFDLVFGDMNLLAMNQCGRIPVPVPGTAAEIGASLLEVLRETGLAWPSHGIVVVADREAPPAPPVDGLPRIVARVMDLLAPCTRPARPIEERAPEPWFLERLRCPSTGARLAVQGNELAAEGGGPRYPLRAGIPVLHRGPTAPPERSLREVIELAFGAGSSRVDPLLELARVLRFDLPPPLEERRLLARGGEGWEAVGCASTAGSAGEGTAVAVTRKDPQLLSPRLARLLRDVRGFRLEIAARAPGRTREEAQLYLWTLHRPLWWEGASVRAVYPADGAFHVLELPVPEALAGGDDELLRLRLDPCHEPADVEIRSLKIL